MSETPATANRPSEREDVDSRMERIIGALTASADQITLPNDQVNTVGEIYERRGYQMARAFVCAQIERSGRGEEGEGAGRSGGRRQSWERFLDALDKMQEEAAREPKLPSMMVAFPIRKLNALKECAQKKEVAK